MKRNHLLTRSLAATAVAGLAFMGFASAAGAATVSVTVPPILGGGATSTPVVTVGSSPSVTPAPGVNVRVPGVDATVPVHAAEGATVGSSTVGDSTVAPITAVGGRHRHIVSEHASVDVCIVAAVLTGHTLTGCNVDANDSSSTTGAVTQADASSLATSLSRIGACVRVALLDNRPIDTCSASNGTPVTVPVDGLGSPVSTIGDNPVGDIGSGNGSDPTSALTPDTAVAKDTVKNVLVDNGLCVVAQSINLVDTCVASDSTGSTNGANPDRGTNLGGTTVNTTNVCLGLVAVIGVDPLRCSGDDVHALADGRDHRRGSTDTASHPAGTVGDSTSSSSSPLNAACAPRESSIGGGSPFENGAVGGIAGLGFVLAGLATLIRRPKRAVVA